jgi:hypothetical protein
MEASNPAGFVRLATAKVPVKLVYRPMLQSNRALDYRAEGGALRRGIRFWKFGWVAKGMGSAFPPLLC